MTLPGLPHPFAILAWLVIIHMLCDYPLQGDFLSKAKTHVNPIVGVPWYQALVAHAIIQAGGVWLVTGLWQLAAFEYGAHILIDYAKNEGITNYNTDQALHIACKVLYVVLIVAGAVQ